METFLLCLGLWYPHDGFGLPVAVSQPPGTNALAGKKSDALVLHLHGSLSIQTHEYEITHGSGQAVALLKERDEPLYVFEPLSVSANFAPCHGQGGADDVEERIIPSRNFPLSLRKRRSVSGYAHPFRAWTRSAESTGTAFICIRSRGALCLPREVWGGHSFRHTSKTGTRPVSVSGAHLIDLLGLVGTPEWIRTTDLLLRRQTLYPSELRARMKTKELTESDLLILAQIRPKLSEVRNPVLRQTS